MQLPSLFYLKDQAIHSFKRFPISIISAIIGVVIAVFLVHFSDEMENNLPYINMVLVAAMGIPLFFSLRIFAEKNSLEKKRLFMLYGIGTTFLILLFFTMPTAMDGSAVAAPYIRYVIYNICIHLLVAIVPYLNRGEINGFWQYNKMLFIRILTSALYSGVLFIGLVLAIVSLIQLFELKINDRIYFQLFIVIAGIFNTWFFLSGIPKDINTLDQEKSYPNSLRIFTQYILISLLSVYLFILYAYITKIIISSNWPIGIVSYMIICVAVVGILTLLLMYPYQKEASGGWVNTFGKVYYFLLVPLIVVLFMAIGMRVSDYGITINRYILISLGVWLSIITLYYISGRTNIKMIPISLGIITLLISFGPWSVFNVSENSQSDRLISILENSALITNGKVNVEVEWDLQKRAINELRFDKRGINEHLVDDSLHNEIKSILDYLNDFHGLQSLDEIYGKDINTMIDAYNKDKAKNEKANRAEIYMELLGLEYTTRETISIEKNIRYGLMEHPAAINIEDYNQMIAFNYSNKNPSIDTLLKITLKDQIIEMKIKDFEILAFDISPILNLKENDNYFQEMETMTIKENQNIMEAKIVLKTIDARNKEGVIEIENFNGYLLLSTLNN